MPSEGEKLDELLSGLLDGELSSDDLKAANAELESAQTRDRFDDLKLLSQDVRAAFKSTSHIPAISSKDLAANVIATARLEASQMDLADDHPILLGQRNESNSAPSKKIAASEDKVSVDKSRSWGQIAITIAVMAAIVLLAVQIPGFLDYQSSGNSLADGEGGTTNPNAVEPIDEPGDSASLASNQEVTNQDSLPNVDPFEPEGSEPLKYVSGLNFKQTVVMVIDIELSSTAKGAERFDEVLRKHGLLRDEPVMAGDDIASAVTETRMMVRPEEDARASEATIYFVRSDFRVLGAALDELYFDKESFPNLSFSLAVDNPMVRLVEKIAKATGQRFLADQAFAVPVRTAEDSPFSGLRKPARLVSAKERQQGFSGGMAQAFTEKGQLNSLLFFVR